MLSKRIKSLRLKKELTQKDLSDKLGLTPKMVSFYELGDRVPPPDILEKLADIFHVTVDYLMCRSDKTICSDCGYSYNPLDDTQINAHNIEHENQKNAVNKYGFYWNFNESWNKRFNAEFFLKENISKDEVNYMHVVTLLKADFSDYLRQKLFSPDIDFNAFCAKELKEGKYSDLVSESVYKELLNMYGVDKQSSQITLNEHDNRDIRKDLDSLMEKLSEQEYGPAAFDGEDLSPEAAELFKEELEIALKRLKFINKEKYNPYKNKK